MNGIIKGKIFGLVGITNHSTALKINSVTHISYSVLQKISREVEVLAWFIVVSCEIFF